MKPLLWTAGYAAIGAALTAKMACDANAWPPSAEEWAIGVVLWPLILLLCWLFNTW